MPIEIVCESCDGEFRVKDELAGKLVRCRSCTEPIRVPGGKPVRAAAVRRPKPVADEMDDWGDSGEWDEPALPKPRAKATAKKKKRKSAGVSIDVGSWFRSLSTVNVGPLLLQGGAALLAVLFVAGFWFPAAAAWFMFSFLITVGLAMIGSWIGLFVIAARENVICMILCFFVPYKIYYIFSRWDRTGGVFSVWLVAALFGYASLTGAGLAYDAAQVDWRRGDMAFLGEINLDSRPPRRPPTPASFAPPPNLMSPKPFMPPVAPVSPVGPPPQRRQK